MPKEKKHHAASQKKLAAKVSISGYQDRFIPYTASTAVYRASLSLRRFDPKEIDLRDQESSLSPQRLSSPEFFNDLRETGNYEPVNSQNTSIFTTDSPNNTERRQTITCTKLKREQEKYRDTIAELLGFHNSERVLTFNQENKLKPLLKLDATLALETTNLNEERSRTSTRDPRLERGTKRVKSHAAYKVLDAPCLRNDFYSNLISWSKTTNAVLVGLGCSSYMWSEASFGCHPSSRPPLLIFKR